MTTKTTLQDISDHLNIVKDIPGFSTEIKLEGIISCYERLLNYLIEAESQEKKELSATLKALSTKKLDIKQDKK